VAQFQIFVGILFVKPRLLYIYSHFIIITFFKTFFKKLRIRHVNAWFMNSFFIINLALKFLEPVFNQMKYFLN